MDICVQKQLPPCGSCDVEAMESWLGSMAQEGWLLTSASGAFGRFAFVQEAPQKAAYRLIPLKKRADDQPHPYFIQDMEKIGWEYVRKWGEFFIFRSFAPAPQEPYSSPDSHAAELNLVKKRTWQNYLTTVLLVAALFAWVCHEGFARMMLAMLSRRLGLPYLWLFLGTFVWILVPPISNIRKITDLQRRLRGGNGLNRSADWQKHACRNRAGKITGHILLLLMCTSALVFNLTEKWEQKPLSALPFEPPFATLEELAPQEADVTAENFLDPYYTLGRGIFIPRVLHVQTGINAVYEDNGYSTAGIMEVEYLEAPSHAIAMALAKDLNRSCFRERPLEAPFLDQINADYAAAGVYRGPRVILVQGNHLIFARFTMGDLRGNFTLENWMKKTAGKLR